MSTLDGQDVFAAGPHSIRPGAWERQIVRRGLAGLDGELVLDLGLRSRQIIQTGRLQADSAEQLQALIEQIESFADGCEHVLVGAHGLTYSRVILESFETTGPVRTGRGVWCDYTARYRQLP